MDNVPSESPASTPTRGTERSWIRDRWTRAALTVALVAGALTVLLGREDPTIFGAVRDKLFHRVSPSTLFTPAQTPLATPDPLPLSQLLPLLQQRSLRVPALAAGEACVTAPGKAVSPDLGDALGDGPVYMVGYGMEGTSSIYNGREDGGWYYLKTIWTAPPDFHGAFLLRGRQIDGPNEVRFSEDTTATPDMQVILSSDPVPGSTPSGWLPWITYARVRAPGCYGIQVDGLAFSEVIRFRVLATPYIPQG
jgi:hypothetical protein